LYFLTLLIIIGDRRTFVVLIVPIVLCTFMKALIWLCFPEKAEAINISAAFVIESASVIRFVWECGTQSSVVMSISIYVVITMDEEI
jgi:hypothetical protein